MGLLEAKRTNILKHTLCERVSQTGRAPRRSHRAAEQLLRLRLNAASRVRARQIEPKDRHLFVLCAE